MQVFIQGKQNPINLTKSCFLTSGGEGSIYSSKGTAFKIYINPKVPEWMDYKDLNDRSASHMDKWFGRAYIRTEEFGEDTYQDYRERMAYTQEESYEGDYTLETEEEFNTRRTKEKEQWLEWWPDGVRYDVRCLDGGAWDRTTNKGSYKTLDEAMRRCKEIME